jgi:TATA-binding protein-associated factor Taf7
VNLIKSSFVVGFSILAIIACGTQPTNSDSQILLRGTESESSILEIGRGKNSSQEKSKKKSESKSSKKEDCDDEDEEHEDDEHDDDNDEKEGSDESKNASVGCATQALIQNLAHLPT